MRTALLLSTLVVSATFAGAWAAPDNAAELARDLGLSASGEPPSAAPLDWGPVPIWWWSGDPLKLDRLTWQLDRMKAGGLRNAVLLNLAPSGPLYGSDSDEPLFFSDEWWGILEGALAAAQERGMHVWLYDQLGFSGAGLQDKIIARDPGAYAGWSLHAAEADVGGAPERVALPVPAGAARVAAYAYPVANERLVGERAAPIDVDTNGSAEWPGGSGAWKLMVFYATRGGFDYLSKPACAALLDSVHGEYERRIGRYLGNVVPGTFQDELPPHQGWTGNFLRSFRARHGYDLAPLLAGLFHDIGGQTTRVRCDYFDTCAAMAEEAFYRPLNEWHDRLGMRCGIDQCIRNGDPVAGQQHYFDYFRTQRWFAMPGNDQFGSSKVNSSLAHIYGRPRVWQEGYYNSGWGQTLEELLAKINGSFADGGTLYNPHAFYYSTHGAWWEWAPPCTSFRQPYWEHYPVLAGYVSRLSYLLTRGSHVCDIAVLYPSRTVQAETTLSGGPSREAQVTGDAFWAVVNGLRGAGYDLDVVDEDSLVRDGGLDVMGEHYRCLVLPRVRTISEAASAVINGLPADREVIAYQGLPEATCEGGRQGDVILRRSVGVDNVAGLVNAVANTVGQDVLPVSRYLHRRVGGCDVYFLPTASGGQRYTFRVKGAPEIWDLYAGRVLPPIAAEETPNDTSVQLPASVGPSAVVVFTPGALPRGLSRTNLLSVAGVAPDGDGLAARGSAEAGLTVYASAEAGGRHYYGETMPLGPSAAEPPSVWECELVPTMDNRWGDFELPANPGPLPVDCRRFRYQQETAAQDGLVLGWQAADFDDSPWPEVTYSVGPRCLVSGILPAGTDAPPDAGWTGYSFSTRFGIENDPTFGQWLGPKGHVLPEFLDLGQAPAGGVRFVRTWLIAKQATDALLLVGAPGPPRAWLNGGPVPDDRRVSLHVGRNELLIRLEHTGGSPLRAYFMLSKAARPRATPSWIWHPRLGSAEGTCVFRKSVNLEAIPESATATITADNGYHLYINGQLIGSDVGADTWRWQTAETYDIRAHLRAGDNDILVVGTNLGGPAGLLAVFQLGGQTVATDATWETALTVGLPSSTSAAEATDRVPACVVGKLGDQPWNGIANMPGERASGPTLPDAWFLERNSRPADYVEVGYDCRPDDTKRIGWYRFTIPPGATGMRLEVRGRVSAFVDGQELPVNSGRIDIPDGDGAGPRQAALRVIQRPGEFGGAPFHMPITFDCARGRLPLGSWHTLGLRSYSGGIVYTTRLPADPERAGARWVLDLGRVRGTAEVSVNGRGAGIRIAPPWQFDLTRLLGTEAADISVKVFGTLGPHYRIANQTPYVYPGQEVTGLFGPVRLLPVVPVEIALSPHEGPELGSERDLANWALPAMGATASASSEKVPGYAAASALSDDVSGANWARDGGWNDDTVSEVPDWLQVNLGRARTVTRIVVVTHPDAAIYGIRDYDVACRVNSQWRTVARVRGNSSAATEHALAPVTTDAVRVTVLATNDGSGASGYSRIVALKVLGPKA